MTLCLSVAARRAALIEHATVASQQAARTPDAREKRALLRDARDMMGLALALETDRAAA